MHTSAEEHSSSAARPPTPRREIIRNPRCDTARQDIVAQKCPPTDKTAGVQNCGEKKPDSGPCRKKKYFQIPWFMIQNIKTGLANIQNIKMGFPQLSHNCYFPDLLLLRTQTFSHARHFSTPATTFESHAKNLIICAPHSPSSPLPVTAASAQTHDCTSTTKNSSCKRQLRVDAHVASRRAHESAVASTAELPGALMAENAVPPTDWVAFRSMKSTARLEVATSCCHPTGPN
jgi:hypothetical protein